ncbi:MAG: hypothetical protein PF690_16290 [Deltaproteobacteria bacterium]|jgi:hypothetical protein|nr:hypothetical protein [Deltaproteobacteria bacterium]
MPTVTPKGENLKKAIKFISEKRQENPDINLNKLVDDAGLQFDLSPKECEFLLRFVKDDNSQNTA